MSDLLHPYHQLLLQSLLVINCPCLKTKGDGAFEVVAPTLRNTLPSDVQSAISVDAFKKQLKTPLFKLTFVSPLTV